MRRIVSLAVLVLLAGCSGQGDGQSGDQGGDQSDGPQFTRYHLEVEADETGQVATEIDVTYDFADEPSHGIYFTLLTEREIEGDDDRVRHTPVVSTRGEGEDPSVTVTRQSVRHGVQIHLGDEQHTVTGEHDYLLFYRMDGLVDSGVGPSGEDEIYWNVIGHDFDEPINNITLTFTGPSDVVRAECWAGEPGTSDPCLTTDVDGDTVSIAHDRLEPGEGMTLGLAFAPGAFEHQEPLYLPASEPDRVPWGAITLGLLGAVAAGCLSYFGVVLRFRDEKYLDLPLGLTPRPGEEAKIGKAGVFTPKPAVAFTPPEGVGPAQAAALVRDIPGPHAVTATVIDLAIRGYLTIDTLDKGVELTKSGKEPRDALTSYERALLDALFSEGDVLRVENHKSKVPTALAGTASVLEEELQSNGWIKDANTRAIKVLRWVAGIGALPLLLIVGAMVAEGVWIGAAVLAPPLAFFGAIAFALVKVRQRSALGYAKYAQTLAFVKYLHTAEARQLQFEADVDIYTRYLPYAIALGEVRKWTAAFANDPARAGLSTPWLNGGATSLILDKTEVTALFTGVGMIASAGGYSGGFSGAGRVGGGLGGGGGGRW